MCCAEGKKFSFEVGITCVKLACNNNYLSQQDIWLRKEDLKLLLLLSFSFCSILDTASIFDFPLSLSPSFIHILLFFMTRKINIFAVTQKRILSIVVTHISQKHGLRINIYLDERNFSKSFSTFAFVSFYFCHQFFFVFTLLLRNQFCPCQFPLSRLPFLSILISTSLKR